MIRPAILGWAAVVAAATVMVLAAQQGTPVRFSNIAAKAGIDFKHESGATPYKYMPETMTGGGLFFDYDNDGWLDVFLVNGGSFVDKRISASARHRLFHNNGNGTF